MSAGASLSFEVQEYLRDRRHLGFSLGREGTQLLAFARFAEAHGYDGHLTEGLAKAWAQHGQPHRLTSARRLDVVRRFFKYRRQFDSRTKSPTPVSSDPRPVALPRTSMKLTKSRPC
jgi:hypothetical protein